MSVLIDYRRSLAREYYAQRIERWRRGGPEAVAADRRDYSAKEPHADVQVTAASNVVELDIRVCHAIRLLHL